MYRVALDASPQRQGLAAALSVIIFLIVAVISAIGFKYTKAYEEVRVSTGDGTYEEGIYSVGKYPAAGMVEVFSADKPYVSQRRRPFGRWFRETGWRHIVGVLALLFALFPVWFVVLAAFSESASLTNQRLWPESFTLRQFRTLLDNYPFWQWFFNSLVISPSRRRVRCCSPRRRRSPSPGCASVAAGQDCSACC